ncbi:MAG: NADPH-dependent glutamate synthase [Thermaerobacter sp.]|nr:NADPH-dependent glutamate synthase [Thermaerobacter sp.]
MPKIRPERLTMPVQDPKERRRNFREVALGFTPQLAREEAERCIQCKNPFCEDGCPVHVPIREFIDLLQRDDPQGALAAILRTNALPAVCGRVCPQEDQCEKLCVLAKRYQPVAIGRLERYVADLARDAGRAVAPRRPRGPRVAVVGGGPAGLTAAGTLAGFGYRVTLFDALHTVGGVLMYGIPEFRLPKDIVRAEVEGIQALGVEIRTDAVVGQSPTVDELLEEGYEAVFLGTGAGLPRFLHIPGENLDGVYSANEFLTRVNLMGAWRFPEWDTPVRVGRRVAVIGAGNTAMDAVRTALRVGAEEAMIVYRRSPAEMTARHEEYEHAVEEGVEFRFLTNPQRILDDGEGRVRGLEVLTMELGEPDRSGRCRPVPVAGSEHVLAVDTVILALGTSPNPVVSRSLEGLEVAEWGGIRTDEHGATSRLRVYAGGDAVTGAATVILAMGAGKRAAQAIHRDLAQRGEAVGG